MFYTVKLTNSLFRPSIFPYLIHGQKAFKILDFLFIDIWNNIDQLQQRGSCIRMSKGCFWVGRLRAQILLEEHKFIYIEREKGERYRFVSFQKDLRSNLSHSNSTLRHSNTRSSLLKLIYIISSIYKQKIKCFEYFLSIHQVRKNERFK